MELNNEQRIFIDKKLDALSKSKFRSSFKLRKRELIYLNDKGISIMEEHAFDFIIMLY